MKQVSNRFTQWCKWRQLIGAIASVGLVFTISGCSGQDSDNVTGPNQTRGLPSFAAAAFESYLKGSNTEADDRFGASVALDGNTLVVGTPGEDSNAIRINGNQTDNSTGESGAVYVYRAN